MYCSHCGKQISEKAVVCVHCGILLKEGALPEILSEKQPEQAVQQPKKVNGLALAGFITAVSSVGLGTLSVFINAIHYTGLNFQFFFIAPLVAALVLSIIGTVKAKKMKSGMGFGIAGIVISGGTFLIAILYFVFMVMLATAALAFFLFILAML